MVAGLQELSERNDLEKSIQHAQMLMVGLQHSSAIQQQPASKMQ